MEIWKAQLRQRGRGEPSNPWVHWQAIFGTKPGSAWSNHGPFSPTLNHNLLPQDMISTACIMMRKAQDEPLPLKMHGGVISMYCVCKCLGDMGTSLWSWTEGAFHGGHTHIGDWTTFCSFLLCFISETFYWWYVTTASIQKNIYNWLWAITETTLLQLSD